MSFLIVVFLSQCTNKKTTNSAWVTGVATNSDMHAFLRSRRESHDMVFNEARLWAHGWASH